MTLRAKLNLFLGDLFREESFGAGEEEPRDHPAPLFDDFQGDRVIGTTRMMGDCDDIVRPMGCRHLTLVRDEPTCDVEIGDDSPAETSY